MLDTGTNVRYLVPSKQALGHFSDQQAHEATINTTPRHPRAQQQHTQHAGTGAAKPRQSCLFKGGFVSWSHEERRQAQNCGAAGTTNSSVAESHERIQK